MRVLVGVLVRVLVRVVLVRMGVRRVSLRVCSDSPRRRCRPERARRAERLLLRMHLALLVLAHRLLLLALFLNKSFLRTSRADARPIHRQPQRAHCALPKVRRARSEHPHEPESRADPGPHRAADPADAPYAPEPNPVVPRAVVVPVLAPTARRVPRDEPERAGCEVVLVVF